MVQRMRQPCLPGGAWNTLTLPSWLQITTPCTDYCIVVVLTSVLLLVRHFTCSLCLAHHLKQKKKTTNFRSFSYFCSFIKIVLRRKYVHVMFFIHPDCSLYLRGTHDVSACWWCHQMIFQLRCNDISVINKE